MKSFGVCLLLVVLAVNESQCQDVEELSCSDNATCIGNMANQLARSIRENRAIKVFDMLTIEPMPRAQGEQRSNEGPVARFFNSHSLKVDFGNIGVRVKKSMRKDASFEVEVENNKALQEGRRRGKKLLQIFLPLLLGFKAASTMIVAMAAVALLTFKAFLAGKLALLVTGSMLIKKLLENFGGGIGGGMQQQHPYLYSQYPIDFPSAGAQPGYSMPNGNFGSPEMYGITGLGGHSHELLQQNGGIEHQQDATGQYSQPIISGIANPNITSKFVPTAGKRWDGLKRKPMYYENSKTSGDSDGGYQEYDPYEKFL